MKTFLQWKVRHEKPDLKRFQRLIAEQAMKDLVKKMKKGQR